MLLALALGALCPLLSQRVVQNTALRVVWLMRTAQQACASLCSEVRGGICTGSTGLPASRLPAALPLRLFALCASPSFIARWRLPPAPLRCCLAWSQGPPQPGDPPLEYRLARFYTLIVQGCLELSALRQEEGRVSRRGLRCTVGPGAVPWRHASFPQLPALPSLAPCLAQQHS